jgi:hypothetical protein
MQPIAIVSNYLSPTVLGLHLQTNAIICAVQGSMTESPNYVRFRECILPPKDASSVVNSHNWQGRRSVSNIGGAQSLPSRPVSPPFLSLPSLPPFSSFPLSPFPSLPSPFSPLPSPGGPGAMPPENFFRYTCSHASFSAFLTQKSAVYLTRFPDNNFAFLQ